MIDRGNDVEAIVLYLLKDRMKGKMPSLDSPRAGSRDAPLVWRNAEEHVWRFSNCLSLECSATVTCSEFDTLQRYLVRDSRHLLKSTMEKKKTDVEDLGPPVVGMRPCRICRDIEYMTMTDGPRTSTFAFSKVFSKIRTLPNRFPSTTRIIMGKRYSGQLPKYHKLNS